MEPISSSPVPVIEAVPPQTDEATRTTPVPVLEVSQTIPETQVQASQAETSSTHTPTPETIAIRDKALEYAKNRLSDIDGNPLSGAALPLAIKLLKTEAAEVIGKGPNGLETARILYGTAVDAALAANKSAEEATAKLNTNLAPAY